MNRSSDDIGKMISDLRRDMEESKATQITGEGIADGSITPEKLGFGYSTYTHGDTTTVAVPNSTIAVGWKIQFSAWVTQVATAGSLSASNASSNTYRATRNCFASTGGQSWAENFNDVNGIGILRGADNNTNFAGYITFTLDLIKHDGEDTTMSFKCDTGMYNGSNNYTSFMFGRYLISGSKHDPFSVSIQKGSATFSDISWNVQTIYIPGV